MAASEEASVWRQVRFTGDAACPARSGHAALFCASQRSVLVLGGHNETALDDIWRFSLDEQRWQQVEATQPNPLPRVMFTAVVIENDVYLFGGVHEDGVYNDLWKLDTLTGRWELLFEEAPASERCNHAMTATKDGQMVIHGGECLEKLSDGWIFDSQALSWEPLVPQRSKKQKQKDKKKGKSTAAAAASAAQPGPGPRVGHTLAYIAQTDSLLLFGGLSTGLDGMVEPMNDLWVMAMGAETRAWSQVQLHGLAPSPRSRPAYVAITPNTLLILGGYGLKENENIAGEEEEEQESEEGDEEQVEVGAGEAEARTNTEQNAVEDVKAEEEEEDVKEEEEEKHEVEAAAEDEEEEKHEAEEEEESQFEEIVEDFLNDAWLIKGDEFQSVDLNFHASNRFAYHGPARHGLSATLCGDRVLVFGGFDGKEYSDRIDVANVSELEQALRIEPDAETKA